MSRRIRHIHARPDEWVRVHRHRPSNGSTGSGLGCLVMLVVLWLLFH